MYRFSITLKKQFSVTPGALIVRVNLSAASAFGQVQMRDQ